MAVIDSQVDRFAENNVMLSFRFVKVARGYLK